MKHQWLLEKITLLEETVKDQSMKIKLLNAALDLARQLMGIKPPGELASMVMRNKKKTRKRK